MSLDENTDPTKDLVVKNIPKEIPDKDILDLFSEFGTLTQSKFHSKPEIKVKMVFITYKTLEQAKTAYTHLDNYKLKGYQRFLKCVYNYHDYFKPSSSKFTKGTLLSSEPMSTSSTSFPNSSTKAHSPDGNSKMTCVLVTHLEDMRVFWGQPVLQEQDKQAQEIAEQVNSYCQSVLNGEKKIYEDKGDTPRHNPIYYAAKFADGKWYRVEVQQRGEGNALVLFIDYGNSSTEQMNQLILLPKQLCFPPICSKFAILDSQAASFNIKSIFDKYIHIIHIEAHPTDPICSIVKISSVGGVECSEDRPRTSLQSYKILSKATSEVSDSSASHFAYTSYSNQGSQSYQTQQEQTQYNMNTPTLHTSINTSSPMQQQQQPNRLASNTQLTPQFGNVFTFPTASVAQDPQQNVPIQQPLPPQYQHQPQPQPQHPQQTSAFQAYQKGISPESPLQAISTISKLDQRYPHPKYDPLHGPELLNRYRQELEDVDDRMKATSGRVITLEAVNLELRDENKFLNSPESFQKLLHTMTGKVREFLKIKREMYSIEEVSSLREIAQEVLSNRGRMSLSQMSEVVEVHSLQDQLADLTDLIRNNSTIEEPLGQLIVQRDECRSKLITAISSLIETFENFPLEESCEELNARRERLTQVPGYTHVEPKPIDLTVCLETYESVQSFDWRELKLGQDEEEGLEELTARLAGSLKFYQKLVSMDPSEDVDGDEEDFALLVHKIIQTADSDISALKSMEDVHAERRKTASSSLMQAMTYELNRELDEVQSIQASILPQLLLDLDRLQTWQSNTPSLTKLLALRKEIKKVRAGLRHLRVDFQEAFEESQQESIFMIENNIRSVLENFHQLLLREHEELWHLAEQASLHFSELSILYPDLGLLRQIKFGPIFNSGWEQDYFGELEEVNIFQEPTYQTIFNSDKCLLREIKLSSVEQQSVLANNVTKLYNIQHKAVLKCDAFFFNKSGLKAFLKHPSIEGVNIIDFFQANQSSEVSIKWLFSQILHGLSAIHESGLNCKSLTGKDIFISTDQLSVLITSLDLLSEASGQQSQLMHQFDLFNFCTLALSLLTSYEQDVLNLQPANIETLIRDSGLDDCTISFLLLTISKTTTAPFLANQAYFDELAQSTKSLEQICVKSDAEEKSKAEDKNDDQDGEKGVEDEDTSNNKVGDSEEEIPDLADVGRDNIEGKNSSVEGDNEEVQALLMSSMSN